MSALWSTSGAESGILRKNDQKDKLEDLLVFGYACKLFRDDEKALEIDQGKHLIPWMADNTLKIDRYDGRGALSDLTPYESSKEGFDAMRWLGLSEGERRIEQLCDEERYFSLHTNEEEEELYKEEELKRLHNQSSQIQYSYEESPKTEGPNLPPEEDDEPFKPSPELDIPVNMTLPSTVKQNARIEKTALFISKEGPQMEILLKTKQAGNAQFAFLTQEDPLYRYYRHVLMAIKTGRYKIKNEATKTEPEMKAEDEHYLHPSLASATVTAVDSVPSLPPVSYKPSADCAYSQLVSRIQGNQSLPETPTSDISAPNNGAHPVFAHPGYVQQYQQYGFYPQYDPGNPYYPYDQYQYAYTQPQQKSDAGSNPYAQIVSNVKAKAESGFSEPKIDPAQKGAQHNGVYAPNYPQADYYRESTAEIAKAPILYRQKPEAAGNSSTAQIGSVPSPGPVSSTTVAPLGPSTPTTPSTPLPVTELSAPNVGAQKPRPLFSLAQYSGSESENEDDPEENGAQAVVVPPADIQLIIDKMASYVAKNGADFEAIVSSKGDPRFVFLDAAHVFHPYYKYKLKECEGSQIRAKKEEGKEDEEKMEEEDELPVENSTTGTCEDKTDKKSPKGKEKKVITPVSFSIKKPRDTDSVSRDKSALPVEDSTDEDEQNREGTEQKDPPTEEAATVAAVAAATATSSVATEQPETKTEKDTDGTNVIEIEDPIMELIDLTDDLEERRDSKRAEDRLKDKLAAAAREKLAAKNRALQLERKKRAAAFLSQLKPTPNSGAPPPKIEIEETKTVRAATPEEGEINTEATGDEVSRLVYHIDSKSPNASDKEHRSRSSSRHRHKSSHHRRKSHKRSHSHSRKRKRERRSHERKKSKRRYRSKSRSKSPSRHRKGEKRSDTSDVDNRKAKREKTPDHSSCSSDYDSDNATNHPK